MKMFYTNRNSKHPKSSLYYFFLPLDPLDPLDTCESGLFLSSDPSLDAGLVGVLGVFGVGGFDVFVFSFSFSFSPSSFTTASPSFSGSPTFFSRARSFSRHRLSSASALDARSSAAWALSSVDLK